MRIAVMHPQQSGVGYYRINVPTTTLQRNRSHDIEITNFYDEPFKTNSSLEKFLVETAKNYDLVHTGYIVDIHSVTMLVAFRNYANVPYVIDLDDDIFNVPTYNTAYKDYMPMSEVRNTVRLSLRSADGVTVSTTPLCDVMTNNAVRIKALPNCLDINDWNGHIVDPTRDKDKSMRLMFSGNAGRYGDLGDIKEAVLWAMEKYPHLRLFFLNMMPDWAGQFCQDRYNPLANRCFYIPACYSVDTYRAAFKWIAPDILFAPVQCNKFNRSKSHIKAYDAAMSGAALICTDWPAYAAVPPSCAVKVSNTFTQWQAGLEALITDASYRKRLAADLKTWALDEWTIDKHAQKWVDFYSEVIAAGPITDLSQIVRPAMGE